MSSAPGTGQLEAARSLFTSLDGEAVANARDVLVALRQHEDARVREASEYLCAALGALLELDPRADAKPNFGQVLELLALGAERWLDYCEAELAAVPSDDATKTPQGPHLGLLRARAQPLEPLRRLLAGLQAALRGEAIPARELSARFTEGMAALKRDLPPES